MLACAKAFPVSATDAINVLTTSPLVIAISKLIFAVVMSRSPFRSDLEEQTEGPKSPSACKSQRTQWRATPFLTKLRHEAGAKRYHWIVTYPNSDQNSGAACGIKLGLLHQSLSRQSCRRSHPDGCQHAQHTLPVSDKARASHPGAWPTLQARDRADNQPG